MPKKHATASKGRKEFFGRRVERATDSEAVANDSAPIASEEKPQEQAAVPPPSPRAADRAKGRSLVNVADPESLPDAARPKRVRELKISASGEAVVSSARPLSPEAPEFIFPGSQADEAPSRPLSPKKSRFPSAPLINSAPFRASEGRKKSKKANRNQVPNAQDMADVNAQSQALLDIIAAGNIPEFDPQKRH